MTQHPAPTQPATAARFRVGDADRQQACTMLADHYAAGRLDFTEFTARQEAALAATTGMDLTALLRDLPPLPAHVVATPTPQPTRPAASRLWLPVIQVVSGLGIAGTLLLMLALVADFSADAALVFGVMLLAFGGMFTTATLASRCPVVEPNGPGTR